MIYCTYCKVKCSHLNWLSQEIVESSSGSDTNGGVPPEDIMDIPLSDLVPPGTTEENKHRVARYSGHKLAKRKIKELEGQRPLSELKFIATLNCEDFAVLLPVDKWR